MGRPCRHFSYPYGCAKSAGPREFRIAEELGIETAVTTQKGLLYPEHAHELTALPRLSLNGDFQDIRYVKALLSGVPFARDEHAEALSPGRQLRGLGVARPEPGAAFGALIARARPTITRGTGRVGDPDGSFRFRITIASNAMSALATADAAVRIWLLGASPRWCSP